MDRTSASLSGSLECRELLLALITTINELRSHIRFKDQDPDPGLSLATLGLPSERLVQLHRCIGKLFTHRIKIFNEKNNPDVWKVVEGLRFSNPSISLRITGGSSVAATADKGLQWMFQCLQQRCLSENLNWLITDKEHMGQCYESTAFLRDERYADAMMVCFNALERGQPTLLSQIDQSLYAVDQGQTALIGTIKRSESHPNLLLIKDVPTSGQGCVLKRRQTIHLAKSRSSRADRKSGKKMSRSLPNIVLNDYYQATKKKPPDGIDGKLPDPAATSSRAAGPNVPSFNYSDNSVPKPTINILNCEDIKIYTETSSSAGSAQSQQVGCFKRDKSQPPKRREGSRSDLFSLAALTGSPRTLLNEFIPQCGEKITKDMDPLHNKSADSMLNVLRSRPVPGQSLTSFLKTVYFSRTNTELDRENAHFSLSEALIATFEQLKWNEGESISDPRGTFRKRPSASSFWSSYPNSKESTTSTSTAVSSLSDSSSGGSGTGDHFPRNLNLPHIPSAEDEAVEASESGLDPGQQVKSYSAEGVALSLLSKFNEKQLPTACDLLWLVSEQDAPQQILPIPPNGQIANPDDLNGSALNTIIRGTREWAPPRPQIIFTYKSPPPNRRENLTKQNFRCAGCGMKVAPAHSHKFRYCHYLGKYNCSGCHKDQMSAIPAKIIERWDFTFHPVSSFAYHLLNDIATCPLYSLDHLNPELYVKVRVLQAARNIRVNLKYIRDFIVNCRFAEGVKLQFRNIPDHLTNDLDSWSMVDFIAVRNGSFQKEKTEFIKQCEKHIFECELCIAHGFFCENCDRKEIIFPWQKRIVKCGKCGACFHESCWVSAADCVKCNRLRRRSRTTPVAVK
uniref:Run domain Beclin-1-interacting and cysteine-rich domain-containing protein n=1 Tax=Culex pipiens TaxID=7175 RepID=A0A8D8GI23_CULPI